MHPIMIVGMVLVGVLLISTFAVISDDQSKQVESTNQLTEKQHIRAQELASLSATVTDDDNIIIRNTGNTEAKILEIRILDDDGNLISKKTFSEAIPASRLKELIVDSEIKTYIDGIRSSSDTSP